jgi:hypothetical protein
MKISLFLIAIPILVFLSILALFIKDNEYDPYPENKTLLKRKPKINGK